MEPIPPPPDKNPLTGNIPVHKAGDVNAALRALINRKRSIRHDILGRANTEEQDD